MIYRNDLPKSNDLQENVAAILASLAELTKSHQHLTQKAPISKNSEK